MTTPYPYFAPEIHQIPPLEDSGSTALRVRPIKLPKKLNELPIDYPPDPSAGELSEIDWSNLVDRISLHTGQEEFVRYDRGLFKKLYELYRIEPDQEEPVRQYIGARPILLIALIEIHPKLRRYFGDDCVSALTVFVDPEEAFERLFIEVILRISAREAFDRSREFYKQCFSKYPVSVKSHISIDIRLR